MFSLPIRDRTAAGIASAVEAAVREGRLEPGAQLPPVRALAADLGVSPATVAAAYGTLKQRGVVTTGGRRGTRVSLRPPLPVRPPPPLPRGARDLSGGGPDPELLPRLGPLLGRTDPPVRGYGEPAVLPELAELAAAGFEADGVAAAALAVVGGAMDGVERVLMAHLAAGDRVAVEDPGYAHVLDLVAALGLVPQPVGLDREGPLPDELAAALAAGAAALVVTPRAQNPTGVAVGERRAAALREVLDAYPSVLVIEDDHAGVVAGAPYRTLTAGRERWAVVRSVSKALGPDLRLALLAGDPGTVARVEGRQLLGTGWVSHLLQRVVVELLTDPGTQALLARAASAYAERRQGLVGALARHGVPAWGDSGLNVWVPVREEAGPLARLLEAGWAVAPGERYRLRSPPALRVTIATLRDQAEAERLAATLASALAPTRRTRSA